MMNLRTADGVVHLMKFGGADNGIDETECGVDCVTNSELPYDLGDTFAVLTDRKVTCIRCLAVGDQPWRIPR